MSLFLKNLTFSSVAHEVAATSVSAAIRLKPYQILIWLSISLRDVEQLDPGTPRVPALLDTGHNHFFSAREDHCLHSGLVLPLPGSNHPLHVRDSSGTEWPIPRVYVDVWLHSDLPEWADRPYPLRLGNRGAACYLANGTVKGPSLPLLGLAAFCAGSLELNLQCNPAGGKVQISIP